MSAAKIDKLVRMANQIGAAFGTSPEREAVASTAAHLKLYWTPKMIREIVAFVGSGRSGLSPTAALAVATLKESGAG